MTRNFIETGAGRCRICDFSYSRDRPQEVREHRAHHHRYLEACDGVGAPVNRFERARMMEEGTGLLAHGTTLAEQVKGAERQLASHFHARRGCLTASWGRGSTASSTFRSWCSEKRVMAKWSPRAAKRS